MLLKLKTALFVYKEKIALVFIVLVFLCITIPALFSHNHILYNLEPYPDGMLYILSAKNFVEGHGLNLIYKDSVLPLWVPPLYPLVLSIGYLAWSVPQSFYLTNIVLQVFAITVLFFLLLKTTKSLLATIFGCTVFISHLYTVWLPTVPMTENLVGLLLILSFYGLFQKVSLKTGIVTIGSCIALLLTRFSVAPTVGLILILFLLRLFGSISKKKIGILLLSFIICIGVLFQIVIFSGNNLLAIITNFFTSLEQGGTFYSFSYSGENAQKYLSLLLGHRGLFLWLSYPVTSTVMSLSLFIFLIFLVIRGNRNEKWNGIVLLTVFFSQFLLLLIFYTVDARYIILSIPIFAVSFGFLISYLEKKYTSTIALLTGCCILGIHLISQIQLGKELISFNILHRSKAWQYEAIKEFDIFFSTTQNAIVITALPPFLVDAYQVSQYSILPLSTSQEFLQKKEFVWGTDVPYDNLLNGYKNWLQHGKKLYISNAYITQQQSVIQDFEAYKKNFNFQLVHSGCLEACNIYELQLKEL